MPESVEAHNGAVGYQLANDAKSPHNDDYPDPHKIKPDPDRDPGRITVKSRVRIRVKVKSWVKIRMKVMWICNTPSP
jgi:hypothetical protein